MLYRFISSGIYRPYYLSPPSFWKRYVPDKCVFWNDHININNHLFIIMDLTKPLRVWMKGPMLICFFLWKDPFLFVTTPATNILWILPVYFGDLHEVPQRCKTFQLSESRSVEPLCLEMETRWESAIKLWFSDDIVIKPAASLTMWYIWELTYLS